MESKYQIIKSDLSEKIKRGFYEAGKLLPSETELASLYGSSRETVRKALRSLVDLGLIQKIRGRGSMVIEHTRHTFPISQLTSFQELNNLEHLNAKTELLSSEYPVLSPNTFIGHKLETQHAQRIRRVRIIDGQKAVLDEDYLLDSIKLPISNEVLEGSLYKYLEEQLGYQISYATKSVTVEKAPSDVAEILDTDIVAVIRSLVYLEDTKLFQLTTSYHRPDKFQFVDFARRTRI
ncbi:MAG: trehalose operon repressor [Lactobacillus sp.]|nr:trehalose operon repressor [Lactobacillus sp.]